MSITDELRGYVMSCDERSTPMTPSRLLEYADRIDAEHQKALDEWKAENGQMWLKGYSECHAELTEGNETLASDLEGCGWVRLPKDADGEYIRVGDAVTCVATVWTVTGLKFLGEGWSICCTVYNKHGGSGTTFYPPSDLHHYHAPTVEDILREFALRAIRESEGNYGDLDETCAEYAKRLRLAGDGE